MYQTQPMRRWWRPVIQRTKHTTCIQMDAKDELWYKKHSKSLKSGYRKYYQKMTWSVFCQISFFFQVTILTQFVLLNLVSLVDAIEQYNRLSISDKSLTTIQRDSDLDVNAFNDFRHVSHDELLRIGDGFDSFTDPGVTHFSEILFDFNHYQVCRSKPSCQKIYI